MKTTFASTIVLAAALALGGCAFVPKTNVRLDEARSLHRAVAGDETIVAVAPAEMRRADEALEKAVAAWNTLQDPAEVDHLAYVAKQRAAIARETARRALAEAVLAAATREREALLANASAREHLAAVSPRAHR